MDGDRQGTVPPTLQVVNRPLLSQLVRTLRWHRRTFAAFLAAVAVYASLQALAARDGTVAVVTAVNPISGGQKIDAADVAVTALPGDAVPEGAIGDPAEVIGRIAIAALPRRAVLTPDDLVTGGRLVSPGRVALPVSLGQSAAVELVKVGDTIDILGSDPAGESVAVVASGVRVVAMPATDSGGMLADTSGERVVLVEVSPAQAAEITASAALAALSISFR